MKTKPDIHITAPTRQEALQQMTHKLAPVQRRLRSYMMEEKSNSTQHTVDIWLCYKQ